MRGFYLVTFTNPLPRVQTSSGNTQQITAAYITDSNDTKGGLMILSLYRVQLPDGNWYSTNKELIINGSHSLQSSFFCERLPQDEVRVL